MKSETTGVEMAHTQVTVFRGFGRATFSLPQPSSPQPTVRTPLLFALFFPTFQLEISVFKAIQTIVIEHTYILFKSFVKKGSVSSSLAMTASLRLSRILVANPCHSSFGQSLQIFRVFSVHLASCPGRFEARSSFLLLCSSRPSRTCRGASDD